MNVKLQTLFIIVLISFIGIFLMVGCAMVIHNMDEENLAKVSQMQATKLQTSEVMKTVFSTTDLPSHFLLVVGDKVHDFKSFYSELLPLSHIVVNETLNPQSFWLVSPFYEPREYFFRDFDLSQPIMLASLASEISATPLDLNQVRSSMREMSPFSAVRSNNTKPLYYWGGDDLLMIPSYPHGVGLVHLNKDDADQSQHILPYINQENMVISKVSGQAAYIEQGYLVIDSLDGQNRKKYALTKNPEVQNHTSFSVEFISWSPNGRYIVGSNHAYFEHYLHKLWMLDLQTGRITGFSAWNLNSFQNPIWSPDGNQLVVGEYMMEYSKMVLTQYTLLDLRSKKMIFAAKKNKVNWEYDFTWDKTGKLSYTLNPSSLVEAYDPVLKMEQTDFKQRDREDMRYLATTLRFLNANGEEVFQVDLQPALEKSGLVLEDIYTLYVNPLYEVKDSEYLYFTIKASTLNDVRLYTLYGRLNLTNREVSLLGPLWARNDDIPSVPKGLPVFKNHKLIEITDNTTLSVIDLQEMKIVQQVVNDPLLAACWFHDKLLYITERGIYTTEIQAHVDVWVEVGRLEAFSPEIRISPNGSYLAVTRNKLFAPIIESVTLTIIDLVS